MNKQRIYELIRYSALGIGLFYQGAVIYYGLLHRLDLVFTHVLIREGVLHSVYLAANLTYFFYLKRSKTPGLSALTATVLLILHPFFLGVNFPSVQLEDLLKTAGFEVICGIFVATVLHLSVWITYRFKKEKPPSEQRAFPRFGLVLIPFAMIFLYVPFKIRWAKRQATQLCSEFPSGSPVANIIPRARDLGLHNRAWFRDPDRPGVDQLLNSEGFMYSRWYCRFEAENGVVTVSRVFFLD